MLADGLPVAHSATHPASSPWQNAVCVWDRLFSRSFQARQREETGWKACPTYLFNGLLGVTATANLDEAENKRSLAWNWVLQIDRPIGYTGWFERVTKRFVGVSCHLCWSMARPARKEWARCLIRLTQGGNYTAQVLSQ